MGQLILRNTRPAVGDADLDHLGFPFNRCRGDADPSTFTAVLGGVAQKVQQRVPERRWIAQNRSNFGVHAFLDHAAGLRDDLGGCVERTVDEEIDAYHLSPADRAARFGVGKEQHLLDDARQPFRLLLNQGAIALHLLLAADQPATQIVRGGADHAQRGSQLVRDARHELHLQLGQSLGAPGEPNQRARGRQH